MEKEISKEYSLLNNLNFCFSPLISAISGYMYLVTREYRYTFGPLIGEHVSNFFGTALAMYLVTALTTGLEKNTELESIKKLAVFVQVTCAVALVGLNLHFESFEGNTQFTGDMISSLIALAVVWVNTRYVFDKLSKEP